MRDDAKSNRIFSTKDINVGITRKGPSLFESTSSTV